MKSQEKKDRLLERIVAHFTKRIRDGKFPSIDRYKREYPEYGDEIEEILSSVAMIEELKQLEVSDQTASCGSINRLTQEKLGDYRVIRELGRGGMGVVFEAVHESLGGGSPSRYYRKARFKIHGNWNGFDAKRRQRPTSTIPTSCPFLVSANMKDIITT